VARLVQLLEGAQDYRVRLQAVLVLGKLGGPRAMSALRQRLSAPKALVRGMTATMLAQAGDVEALPLIKRALRQEKDKNVIQRLKLAIGVLSELRAAPPPGTRYYITMGKVVNNTKEGGEDAARSLGEILLRELGEVEGIISWWGSKKYSPRMLARRKIKGYVVDGAILQLEHAVKGDEVELSCKIKVMLSTYPGNSMKTFYTGNASTRVAKAGFAPGGRSIHFDDLIEGVARGARKHLVRSYLD